MGQLVAVVEKPSRQPGIVRFEANRALTGQGHERFGSPADAVGPRPAAELARRLFATGQVEGVHLYSNIITVNLNKGFSGAGLDEVVRDLYTYWVPGREPATFAEPEAETAAVGSGDAGGGDGGGDSEYTRRVPAHLIERSRAAMEKWRATH